MIGLVWNYDTLPLKEGDYLVCNDLGLYSVLHWCEGWNCRVDHITGEIYKLYEITDIVCWAEIPAPDRSRICQ